MDTSGKTVLKGDTFSFDFGAYSDCLFEFNKKLVPISEKSRLENMGVDLSDVIFRESTNPCALDFYRTQNVDFYTINGLEVKITYPRIGVEEKGYLGFYINGGEDEKLSFYCENPRFTGKDDLIELLKSIEKEDK